MRGETRPGRVALLMLAALCVVVLAALGCGGSSDESATTDRAGTTTGTATPPPDRVTDPVTPPELAERGLEAVWSAEFEQPDDGVEFSSPSGSEKGDCRREVRDGAALFTWEGSDEDGDSTRCYPNHVFSFEDGNERIGEIDAPWVFSGRFYIDIDDPAQLRGGFLSIITFQPAPPEDRPGGADNAWTSVVTINLGWEDEWEEPRLNIFHVPEHGEGRYERVRDSAFPLGRWVDVRVEWDEGNNIEVFQDGKLIITAEKTKGRDGDFDTIDLDRAELHGMHFGGYASGSVQGWVIGNDDLVVAVPAEEAQRRRRAGP